MQHVIVRRRLDRRIVILLGFLTLGAPFLGMKALVDLRTWHETHLARRAIEQGRLEEANRRLEKIMGSWGLRSGTLELLCDVEMANATASGDPHHWQRVIRASRQLEATSWRKPERLDEWLGWAAYRLGPDHYEEGITHLRKVQASGASSTNLSEALYAMFLKRRYFADAANEAERLCALNPANPEYPVRRALVALEQGETVKAREILRDLVFTATSSPEHRRAVNLLLGTLRNLRLPDETEFVYTWLLDREPMNPEWVSGYGLWLMEKNEVSRARNLLWVAVLSNQTNQMLRTALSKTF